MEELPIVILLPLQKISVRAYVIKIVLRRNVAVSNDTVRQVPDRSSGFVINAGIIVEFVQLPQVKPTESVSKKDKQPLSPGNKVLVGSCFQNPLPILRKM